MNIYQEMRVAKDECYTTTAESDKLVGLFTRHKSNHVGHKNMVAI